MTTWIPVLIFAGVTAAIWRLYEAAGDSFRRRHLLRRLYREDAERREDFPSALLSLLARLGCLLPSSEAERERLRARLDRAGIPAANAPDAYGGLRLLCALAFGGLCLGGFVAWRGVSTQALILSYVALMLGYYVPAWALGWRERNRTRRILLELPDAIDILLVCMHAGLSFDRALFRVSRELKFLAPTLSEEFERYFFEVESGLSRQKALANLADRNRVEALTAVINVLVQSVNFGTDIASALRVHADDLRTARKQTAEERAAKVSTKLVFPTVLFIMPALMIVVLGPAGIRLLERLRELSL